MTILNISFGMLGINSAVVVRRRSSYATRRFPHQKPRIR